MGILIPVLGAVTAAAAAARSTYSPCGLSMLSSLTPFGERSRGHRYAVTAAWFVAGATLGGATLGAVAAGLAGAVSASGLGAHPGWVALVVAAVAGLAAAIDAGVGRFGALLPIWRRQVDDGWLVRYRSWVYGIGFGWQIGVGVATYIMTAAVFVVVVLAAMSANLWVAVGICTLFGLLRGLAVLLTARADTPAQLRALHRRVDRAGPVIRVTVIGVEVAVVLAVVAAVAAGGEAVAAWPFVVVVAVTGWAAAAKIRASRARRVWAR